MKLLHDEIAIVPRASNAIEITCNGFTLEIHVADNNVSISANAGFKTTISDGLSSDKHIKLEMKREAPHD